MRLENMECGVSEGGWQTGALALGKAKAFSSALFLSVPPMSDVTPHSG